MSKSAPKSKRLTLAEQLLAMIQGSGMTTNSLAVAAGVPQPVLHRFITGDRPDIRLDTADRLCEFFGSRLTKPTRKGIDHE